MDINLLIVVFALIALMLVMLLVMRPDFIRVRFCTWLELEAGRGPRAPDPCSGSKRGHAPTERRDRSRTAPGRACS